MTQARKAAELKAMHRKAAPLVLYNIWDAAGAKTLVKEGAKAIATGSWSVAAAQGYADGEAMPLDFMLQVVSRITQAVDVPVSIDFEGGYAVEPDEVATNVAKLIDAGAVGLNFEDRVVQGEGLHAIDLQSQRLNAIRRAALEADVPIFVNARTDLFLGSDPATHAGLVSEALERETAYAEAGADGFFVPGLTDKSLIAKITDAARLPVNVMLKPEHTTIAELTELNVSRISFGPGPFFTALADLTERYRAI